ncbi:NAD(P)H-dependent oxidoreductase [Massilia sp. MS-15]|uniref:NAD(P)H-dependent oxidoreductase n=1 Tax=Massilia sp. MS-15 TaxID=2878200 RepID=UPI001CD42025|nr:NAD(P)H-dependent oxidoreductase [Massilia sp. MS-15]MCA1247947.1 NAD(P)H-dependent oxidoreductase [Massilia sp. MS-15]
MGKRILIIQGHPDSSQRHLCHALAEAYAEGARAAGHLVETFEPAQLAFPLLSDPADWQDGAVPAVLLPAQEAIARAQHLLLIYPLWLGDMPARLKGFLEQVLRPGFAIAREPGNPLRSGLLAGRSARVVVTMGMPAPLYRWFYRAHGLQLLRRNILQFAGIRPVATTVVGMAGAMPPRRVAAWRARLYQVGTRAA